MDRNNAVLVLIVQLETKSIDNNIENLKWVFSEPYFIVQVVKIEPPPNVPNNKTLTYNQYVENYTMQKALTFATEGPYTINSQGIVESQYEWTDLPVIVVKDSSISNLTPSGKSNVPGEVIGGMRIRIETALSKASQADLFFLCKWNDACNKYVNITGIGNIDHGSTLKWSVQPTATQAIMYKTTTRDFIATELITSQIPLGELLNSLIIKGTLLATVFVPNIVDFDISLATSNSDYYKLNECAVIQTATVTSTGPLAFIWFSIIAVLILLVAWSLIQLTPGK
jgi:hypothetical protein